MNNFLNSEISLSFSDGSKEFLKAGQPSFYLWHKNGVTLFEEPTWFLHKSFVAKTSSPSINTWSASAHDLKTWFQYLIEIGVNWDEATEQERESYCNDYLNSISPRTGKEFSEDTINRRLTVIKKFYDFARSKGYYIGDIGENTVEWMVPNLPLDKDSLAHTKTTKSRWIQRDPMLLKQGRKDKIKPFLVSDLRKLLNHLNSQNSESEDILVNKRNKLILDMGWVVGLRISEVINLTTLKFLNITVQPGEEFQDFPILIDKSKFNVSRNAVFPGWLIIEIQKYIDGERKLSLPSRKGHLVTKLFLGLSGSKAAGKPIGVSAIQKMISNACLKVGIFREEDAIDIESGKKTQKIVAKHSFHDLRHNCAVFTYHAEKLNGNPEPWKVVQIKLGHKSLKVTIETYLSYVEIFGKTSGLTDIRKLLDL